ncbi:MAG: rod shape-determining protein MreC [Hymenobacteraceae bacterium]|nr:rod shape-determining protein MreC [Hymenobacteraceae bacterium]
MRNLLLFLLRYRSLLLFVGLEALAVYLTVRNSTYHRAAFFNSANVYVGRLLVVQARATEYLTLREQNTVLRTENARLREQLYATQGIADSTHRPASLAARADLDSVLRPGLAFARDSTHPAFAGPLPYRLIPARVINNSISRPENYLTLDVGTRQGVRVGMGVVGPAGVVGRVKVVSEDYATVVSLLHAKSLLGARIRRDGTIGSLRWEGDDARFATLDFVPRHVRVLFGDTIITSGYNAVFPPGIVVGHVQRVRQEATKGFRTIQVRLATNFPRLLSVYVIESLAKPLRDSLEARSSYGEGAAGMAAEAKAATR